MNERRNIAAMSLAVMALHNAPTPHFDEADRHGRWDGAHHGKGSSGAQAQAKAAGKKYEPRRSKPRPKPPGRNAPCPCGSGQKYKKCCLGKPSQLRPAKKEATDATQT